jgi:predicted ribosome quality control (RQC) complex YloA/Tae2 family protein
MVIFFKSINPAYTIYMGKDKYENEELIKWALPIDVWFHVEDLSSAHVYLRLPEGITLDNIPKEALQECAQLVKDNSRDGRKKDKVSVCYTLWENLKKTSSMEVGEVGFHNENKVKVFHGVVKDPDTLKRLNKTMVEKVVNLEAEKESFNIEAANKKKKFYDDNVFYF